MLLTAAPSRRPACREQRLAVGGRLPAAKLTALASNSNHTLPLEKGEGAKVDDKLDISNTTLTIFVGDPNGVVGTQSTLYGCVTLSTQTKVRCRSIENEADTHIQQLTSSDSR